MGGLFPSTNKAATWRHSLRNLLPLSGTPAAAYLESRGLSLEVTVAAGVRFSPSWFGQAAVVFPVRDETGKLVAAQGRYLRAGNGPKARTAGDKKAGIFVTGNFWDEVKKGAPVVVCEAPIDALTLAECGYPALALCGKDGWPLWLPIRCAFKHVALAFDADEAGDAGAQKLDGVLSSLGAQTFRLRPEGGKDWNELLQEQGREALADTLARALL
jgi:DNA primase